MLSETEKTFNAELISAVLSSDDIPLLSATEVYLRIRYGGSCMDHVITTGGIIVTV